MAAGKAGEELNKKAMEIYKNLPSYDHNFRKITGPISFSEAFTIASAKNPELAREYMEELRVGGSTFADGGVKPLVDALVSLSQAVPKEADIKEPMSSLEVITKALENNPEILKRLTGKTKEELGAHLITLAGMIVVIGMMAEKVLNRNADLSLPGALSQVLKNDPSLIRKLKAEYARRIF